MSNEFPPAPELVVREWLNTDASPTLATLRGRVVVVHAFQMLCPGCVMYGLPQAQALHERMSSRGVSVLGLHTVFEHHDVMTTPALRAFIQEYRLSLPIGVDLPSVDHPIPRTMAAYRLPGTPSLLVIDRRGRLRQRLFGRVDELLLGVLLGQLLTESGETA